MSLDQIFQSFRVDDLKWFIPVIGGLFIIIGGLVTGLVRGQMAGVFITLFFGGLLTISPVMLDALERKTSTLNPAEVDVTRSTAKLATLNNAMISDLTRVVTSLRATLDSAGPLLETEGVDAAALTRFRDSLAASVDRLDVVSGNVAQGQVLVRELDANLHALDDEFQRNHPGR